jgi:hypothetical protein
MTGGCSDEMQLVVIACVNAVDLRCVENFVSSAGVFINAEEFFW